MEKWAATELEHASLGDKRRKKRLIKIVEDLASQPGESVPQASRDIAATRAVYDFWNSPYFHPEDIRTMAQKWSQPISDRTIGKVLKQIGFTRKKTYRYRERDEAQRQAFLEQLQAYKKEEVVYVDEAGTDNTEDYAYGWCDRSERFEADKLGHRTSRISMISPWSDRETLAPMTLPTRAEKAALGKTGFVPIATRWIIERSNAWMERCKSLVKNFERTLIHATAKLNLCFIRLMLKRLAQA